MPGSASLSQQTPSAQRGTDIVAQNGWQEFGNKALDGLLQQNGIPGAASDAVCGPIAAAGLAAAFGVQTDPGQLARLGQDKGWWNPSQGMSLGSGVGVKKLLGTLGIDAQVLTPKALDTAIQTLQSGTPVILNFPDHYLLAQDYNPQTGQFFVGATGSNALRGGSDWMTLDQIAALPGAGGALRSLVVPTQQAPSGGGAGGFDNAQPDQNQPSDIETYVRQTAQKYGIDPNVAVAVANSEGGLSSWNQQSTYVDPNTGQREQSYGPFQLFMGGGLGNTFQQQTGLDPRDPANGPAAIDFALRTAAQTGWGPWHGAARVGIGEWQGIGQSQNGFAPTAADQAQPVYHGQMIPGDTSGSGVSDTNPMANGYSSVLPAQSAGQTNPLGNAYQQPADYTPPLPEQPTPVSPLAPSWLQQPPQDRTLPQGTAPEGSSPMDQMPPGARVPDRFLQAGQSVANIPGNLMAARDFYGNPIVPVDQQHAESIVDALNRTAGITPTPQQRDAQVSQYMQDTQNFVAGSLGGGGDVQALGRAGEAAQATRMYHGTGSAFETPASSEFWKSGAVGPAYTLTPNAKIAGQFATDALETGAPQVRAVDVPSDLKVFDGRKAASKQLIDQVAEAVSRQDMRIEGLQPQDMGRFSPMDENSTFRMFLDEATPYGRAPTGQNLFDAMANYFGQTYPDRNMPGTRPTLMEGGHGTADAQAVLRDLGYEGMLHTDSRVTGDTRPFTALGVFENGLPKLRNALSGKAGGAITPSAALRTAGSVAGAGVGYEATPQNASPGETARNVALGALGGYLVTRGGEALAGKLGTQSASSGVQGIDELTRQWEAQRQGPNAVQRLLGGIGDLPKAIETRFTDQYARANATTTAARKALGISSARLTPQNIDAEARLALFADRASVGSQWLDQGLKQPLQQVLQSDQEVKDLNAILKLRRDIEVGQIRLARGANPADLQFSMGVKDMADAQNRLQQLEQAVGPDTWQRYQQAADIYHAHLNDVLDAKVQSGIVAPEMANWLKQNHPNYSPQMLADSEQAQQALMGRNLKVNSRGIQRLSELGHTAEDLPPLQAASVLTLRESNRVMRNDTLNALVDALKLDPKYAGQIQDHPAVHMVNDLANPGKRVAASLSAFEANAVPGQIARYVNGKPVITTGIPRWAEDIAKGMQVAPDKGQAVKGIARWLNSVARTAITGKNPIFPVINGQADAVVALAQGLTPAHILAAYPDVITQSPEFQRFIRLGGGRGGWHLRPQDVNQIEKEIRAGGGFLVKSPADIGQAVKDLATLNVVEKYGNVVEMAPRIAAYKQELGRGATPLRAALAGRRINLDFGRAGTWVRDANAYTLFLNAGIQGVAQMGRIARDNPKAFALFVGGINAAVLGAYAWNRQFQRPDGSLYVNDIPEYIRQTNLVLIAPQSQYIDAQGQPRVYYLAIPLRQMAALATPAMIAAEQWNKQNPAGFASSLARFGLQTLSPVQADTGLGVIGQLLPAGLSTLFELYTNKDFYRGTDIVPQGLQGLPNERKIRPAGTTNATPPAAIAAANTPLPVVGKSLSELGLTNPIALQYAAQDVGAGLGQFGSAIGTLGLNAARGQDTSGAAEQLYQATAGRIYRNRAGGIEQAKSNAFDAQQAAAQDRAYQALKQSPGWDALSTDQQNRLIRQEQNKTQAALVSQLGSQAPQYLQPGAPADGHPPKYVLEMVPPELRDKYTGPNGLYQLEADVNAAQQRISDARTNHTTPSLQDRMLARVGRLTPTRDYRIWAAQHHVSLAQDRQLIQGLVDQALSP